MVRRQVLAMQPCYQLREKQVAAREAIAGIVMPQFEDETSKYFEASAACEAVLSKAYAAVKAAVEQCIIPLAVVLTGPPNPQGPSMRVVINGLVKPAFESLEASMKIVETPGIGIGGRAIVDYNSQCVIDAQATLLLTQNNLSAALTKYIASQNWVATEKSERAVVDEAAKELDEQLRKEEEATGKLQRAKYIKKLIEAGDVSSNGAKAAFRNRIADLEAERDNFKRKRQQLAEAHGTQSSSTKILWMEFSTKKTVDNEMARKNLSRDIEALDKSIKEEQEEFTRLGERLAELSKEATVEAAAENLRVIREERRRLEMNAQDLAVKHRDKIVQAMVTNGYGGQSQTAEGKKGYSELLQFFKSAPHLTSELDTFNRNISQFLRSYKETVLSPAKDKENLHLLSPASLLPTLTWFIDAYAKADTLQNGRALVLEDEVWMESVNDIINYKRRTVAAMEAAPISSYAQFALQNREYEASAPAPVDDSML
eukprot:GHVU01187017.1.p1 GENE.GHVU01187017.1~~GHVU01187017.1.p1  ORF type:complete len:485 (-),score=85.11 GHVU01187017.1:437-1891(-)